MQAAARAGHFLVSRWPRGASLLVVLRPALSLQRCERGSLHTQQQQQQQQRQRQRVSVTQAG
jgi:hypothetical protein